MTITDIEQTCLRCDDGRMKMIGCRLLSSDIFLNRKACSYYYTEIKVFYGNDRESRLNEFVVKTIFDGMTSSSTDLNDVDWIVSCFNFISICIQNHEDYPFLFQEAFPDNLHNSLFQVNIPWVEILSLQAFHNNQSVYIFI